MLFFSKQNTSPKKFFKLKTTLSIFALVVFSLSFLVFATPAFAQTLGLEYGTATGLGTQDLRISIMRIIQVLLGLVGVIAIVIVLYGGFVWMTSAGNPERIDFAKRTLRNAAIGLVIIFSAFSIVSFIIGQLNDALFGPPGGGNPPPDGGCVNCANLGSGLIERVYPEPFAREVARNTSVMVTFKIDMNSSTIIDGCSSLPCSGNLATDTGVPPEPNVLIYREALGFDDAIDADDVIASTNDGKTFIFKSVNNLGNPDSNTWYATTLSTNIQKANGDPALTFGAFTWKYEIGTFLDIDPPYVYSVWPEPDNQGDQYNFVAATSAAWEIEVRSVPQIEVAASFTQPSPTTTGISATGSYTGTQDAIITVTINSDDTANIDWGAGNVNNNPSAVISAGNINLGGGLSLVSASGSFTAGSQWTINATAAKTSDTLRIGDTTYNFTSDNPPGVNEILISPTDTTSNIASAINSEINSSIPGLTSVVSTADTRVVEVEADVAGLNGNLFIFSQTGDWTVITKTQEGEPAGLQSISNGSPTDKARNAVFIIDFNESISPDQLDLSNFTIEYFDGASWLDVTGNARFEISNQYKTIEIFSDEVCLDAGGSPIINSCGDQIYCWPVNTLSATNPEPTNYRVSLRAGALQTCSSDAECLDPNFPSCQPLHNGTANVCSGTFDSTTVYYPDASASPAGIIDATSPGNSFNGNKDTYTLSSGRTHGKADGPVSQNATTTFNLNDNSGFGDDLIWSFYLNTNIDLIPPQISSINPTILAGNVSLVDPVDANFTEVMLSSTLKPGSNYNDGMCGCVTDTDCSTGQTCNDQGLCENTTGPQEFCASDLECSSFCVNKKYVSLVDQSTPAVGWWVSKDGLDTDGDGAFDATTGSLEHTRFLESSNYGAEFGSGIKDSYQNCYQPSSSVTPSCDGTPYCCNGIGMTEGEWELSECFTGY